MPAPLSRLLAVAAAVLSLGAPAAAQMQAPPIKPGLWEVAMQGADGARNAERMKNMTPETRAKIDAMLKQRGISLAGGVTRVCLSKDSLNTGAWTDQTRCKTDFKTRSSSAWKWHAVCANPDAMSDGEAVFTNAENYTVNVSTTIKSGTRQHSIKAVWVSGDCGDVKPLNLAR